MKYLTNPVCHSLLHYYEFLSGSVQSSVENDTIEIDETKGAGFIKVLMVEEGFYLILYNFYLKNDFVFNWFQNKPDDEACYKLVFNIGTGANCVANAFNEKIETSLSENNIVLYSTDFSTDTFISKKQEINRVGMLFTKNWLENNFHEASDRLFDIVNILITKNRPTYIAEQMQAKHYHLVRELTKEITKDNFALIHVKVKAMILLNDFLDQIVERDAEDIKANQSAYFDKIIKVESKIKEYFNKPMPNISALAKEFNMSPATLKRHFKIVYGKSVYHYYLEKKLALGKKMISSQTCSISEIAYALGYNKINSFSKAFKKYYGILPRDMNGLHANF